MANMQVLVIFWIKHNVICQDVANAHKSEQLLDVANNLCNHKEFITENNMLLNMQSCYLYSAHTVTSNEIHWPK